MPLYRQLVSSAGKEKSTLLVEAHPIAPMLAHAVFALVAQR